MMRMPQWPPSWSKRTRRLYVAAICSWLLFLSGFFCGIGVKIGRFGFGTQGGAVYVALFPGAASKYAVPSGVSIEQSEFSFLAVVPFMDVDYTGAVVTLPLWVPAAVTGLLARRSRLRDRS
jgi:hypothetical protein